MILNSSAQACPYYLNIPLLIDILVRNTNTEPVSQRQHVHPRIRYFSGIEPVQLGWHTRQQVGPETKMWPNLMSFCSFQYKH